MTDLTHLFRNRDDSEPTGPTERSEDVDLPRGVRDRKTSLSPLDHDRDPRAETDHRVSEMDGCRMDQFHTPLLSHSFHPGGTSGTPRLGPRGSVPMSEEGDKSSTRPSGVCTTCWEATVTTRSSVTEGGLTSPSGWRYPVGRSPGYVRTSREDLREERVRPTPGPPHPGRPQLCSDGLGTVWANPNQEQGRRRGRVTVRWVVGWTRTGTNVAPEQRVGSSLPL